MPTLSTYCCSRTSSASEPSSVVSERDGPALSCIFFSLAVSCWSSCRADPLRSSKLKDGHGKEQLAALKTRHCKCFRKRYTWLTLGSIPFCCSLLFSLRYLFTFLASNANCFSFLSLLLYPDDFAAAKRSSVSPLGCLLLLLLFECFAICDIESS